MTTETSPAASPSTLQGKVLFVTGASRGIGKAIALRAARDGARIAVAAKTAEPHPKLEGTIFTAAEEIEAAGGEALPLIVDVRSEEVVEGAVAQVVEKWGGIDILVNNASAIMLTGTLETPMKRYDLMHQVNARGTYMCSQKCLPHLLKADNPHILNLAPPLSLNPRWFEHHVAYTMAKYGMSMCVLGMSHEFKEQGVAVNALWPRTGIATAAVNMLGGDDLMRVSRTVDIMSDAAHLILTAPSREVTGQFFIDDEVLRDRGGVTDFDQYKVDPSVPDDQLFPDFFVD
jgi:citronellol/citronellal dehydrogenase